MAKFTVRVELHDAVWSDDYETLHSAMEKQGFSTTITSNDDIEYHLPPAEYNIEGTFTLEQVMTKTKTAAAKVGKEYSVLITESDGRKWYNLKKVE